MSKIANIDLLKTSTGGSQFVNFTNGTIRITVVGEDMKAVTPEGGITFEDTETKAHKLQIFSAELSVPDTGISIPLDNIMGRTRNINDIFNSSGSFSGTTMGTEVLNTTDMTLGFVEDYVYLSDSPDGHIISRDVLRAMLLGETFQHEIVDSKGVKTYDTIKVAGTNGTVKRETKALSSRYFGGMFIQDGKLVVPQATDKDGNPILKPNARVAAYNTTALTVMIEFLYSFSQEKNNGFRFVYVLNGGVTYNEADDANKFSCTAQILCDPRAISTFWINGGSDNCIMIDKLSTTVEGAEVPMTIADVSTKVKDAIVSEGWSTENPVVVYVNKDIVAASTPPARKKRAVGDNAQLSGYMLFTGTGVPVPAYLSENGANPTLVDVSSLEAAELEKLKVNDYIFDIYNYDILSAKFVPYYMPAVKGYYASQMSIPKPASLDEKTTNTYGMKSNQNPEPMSGFRIKR